MRKTPRKEKPESPACARDGEEWIKTGEAIAQPLGQAAGATVGTMISLPLALPGAAIGGIGGLFVGTTLNEAYGIEKISPKAAHNIKQRGVILGMAAGAVAPVVAVAGISAKALGEVSKAIGALPGYAKVKLDCAFDGGAPATPSAPANPKTNGVIAQL